MMNGETQVVKSQDGDLLSLVMREKIMAVEVAMKERSDVMLGDCFPLVHSFGKGLYVREIRVPAGALTVTKIHKFAHPAFLLEGEMSIMEEWGARRVSAPAYFMTKPMTKRVIYHHTDVRLVTVHATEKTDVGEIEEEIIAKIFDDLDGDVIDIEVQNFVKEVTQ